MVEASGRGPRACVPNRLAGGLEHVLLAVIAGYRAIDLEGVALHAIVAKQPVLAHFPDGGARHLERRSVRPGSHHSVVAPRDPPARGDAATVLVLEGLDDVELEVVDPIQELPHPVLERRARPGLVTAGGDDEVLAHQAVDGVRIALPPDFIPEVLDD